MTHENDRNFYKLNFSQREGKVPLPEPMQLEYIPRRFRQFAWKSIEEEISRLTDYTSDPDDPGFFYQVSDFHKITDSYHFNILEKPHDDIRYNLQENSEFVRDKIWNGTYHEVLTLIEYILRDERCSENLYKNLVDTFDITSIAYFVADKGGLPTIMPRPSRETGEATKQAIEMIHEGGMDGAATHLRQAAEHINAGQYADSIADSINAVESVARIIDPKASRTLGPALASLANAGVIKYLALKEAFSRLYGYTKDEQGISHALLEKGSADVGLDEAVFMFGACASFAAYLVSKHRQTEQQQDSGR